MDEFIPKELLTPGLLLGFVVFSIAKGWLVPKYLHQERIKDKQERIEAEVEDRKLWQATAKENAEQVTLLIDSVGTSNRLLESIEELLQEKKAGSDAK